MEKKTWLKKKHQSIHNNYVRDPQVTESCPIIHILSVENNLPKIDKLKFKEKLLRIHYFYAS